MISRLRADVPWPIKLSFLIGIASLVGWFLVEMLYNHYPSLFSSHDSFLISSSGYKHITKLSMIYIVLQGIAYLIPRKIINEHRVISGLIYIVLTIWPIPYLLITGSTQQAVILSGIIIGFSLMRIGRYL